VIVQPAVAGMTSYARLSLEPSLRPEAARALHRIAVEGLTFVNED
jgi:hypothetical protein